MDGDPIVNHHLCFLKRQTVPFDGIGVIGEKDA